MMLSRVADNLYWLSRYLERAEHTARLINVHYDLMLDETNRSSANRRGHRLLHSLHVYDLEGDHDTYALIQKLTFESDNENAIISCIGQARENARQVREQISSEMWMQINQLHLSAKNSSIESIWNSQPYIFFRTVMDGVHLIQGVTDSTMMHDEGWHYIHLGRYMERALSVASLLDHHFQAFQDENADELSPEAYLEWVGLLKCFSAFEAFCQQYSADLSPKQVIEFLLLNETFPHSLRFAVVMMQQALAAIAKFTAVSHNGRLQRLVGRLEAQLHFDQIDEIMAAGLPAYLNNVQKQCHRINTELYQVYIQYAIEDSLR